MPSIHEPEAGPTWAERAHLPDFAGVLDPADADGAKNRLIDRIHKRVLARALGSLDGLRVLDFGCGNGRIASWLDQGGADVDGVDPSPEMIEAAVALRSGARFQTNGETLPFDSGSFAAVVSVTVLQYLVLTAAAGVAVRELRRVLRPAGRLIAIEQAHDGELQRGSSVAGYRAMFEDAGFDVTRASPVRRGNSTLINIALRHQKLADTGIVQFAAPFEARVARKFQRPTPYADWLFVARLDRGVRPRHETN
jgi:SAM-dependent methyltransferase